MRRHNIIHCALAVFAVVALIGLPGHAPQGCGGSANAAALSSATPGAIFSADIPIASMTPGAVRSTDFATILSTERVAEQSRPSTKIKQTVCRNYGVPWSIHSRYEIDHLVPICCGGDPSAIANLWPAVRRPSGVRRGLA